MISISDFYRKLKRQYMNFSVIKAASLKQYLIHAPVFSLYYFFGRGKSVFPLNITLDLTYECNLNCKFCFVDRSKLICNEQYLTIEEIEKLIVSLKGKNTTFLLTGGELTLRRDLCEIVKLIKENGFRCGIFTNATALVAELCDELIKYKLDFLFFSLDGPMDIHDKLRGSGVFNRVYSNINYISKKRNGRRPKIIMNTLILDDNYNRVIEVIDIARELNIDAVAFEFLTFLTGKEFTAHKKFFREKFSNDEFKSLVHVQDYSDKGLIDLPSIIRSLKRHARKNGVQIFFEPDLSYSEIKMWFNREFRLSRKCIYPWNVLRISPYGDVYPCSRFYIKMGNIRNSPIEEIWNNTKFNKFRKELRNTKLSPGCNRCCTL